MIEIHNARVNNLKNVTVNIPDGKLVVISGVSGSGKSSLAFDTLYAEGQRRYVESLSSYARQFLGRMSKPECDYINGLPPAIAIEQKVISRNPRSTVGTSTEIYEYLRLLFARVGRIYSPVSGVEVKKHTADDLVAKMLEYSAGTRFMILAPLLVNEGRSIRRELEMQILQGYSRVYYNNEVIQIDEFLERTDDKLDSISRQTTYATLAERIYLLVDRMTCDDSKDTISRLTDSAETAFYIGHGECRMTIMPAAIHHDFSTRLEADGITFETPTDQLFAFNSPVGVCPTCGGFGKIIGIDEHLVIPNTELSVYDGCVQCWHGEKMGMWLQEFIRRAARYDFPIFTPYHQLTEKQREWLWNGLPCDETMPEIERVSINAFFRMLQDNQYKIQYRVMLARYRGKTDCPDCKGTRLRKEARYVKVGGRDITELVSMPVSELKLWFERLSLEDHEKQVAERLLKEIKHRLQYLLDVGLGYLTLNRPSNSLSGGESQRINLCTSLGSSLVGSLYVLDEPSIGMHSRDTERLIKVLRQLQELGNTVVVVEHDEDMLRAADYLIDIGPEAGTHGGRIVYEGEANDITHAISKDRIDELKDKYRESHTIDYLTGTEVIPVPENRRAWNQSITIRGARMNNLKGVDAVIPLNCMTVVTGVSGSGKSSLIRGILYPALKRRLNEVADQPGEFAGLEGDWKSVKHIEMIDQNAIGKSTRSNPATYIKAYDHIRQLMADQPLAKQMGITAQFFSFNTDGGRCDECKGAGVTTVEMQFMADLELKCESCGGQRFKRDILEVRYEGKNINDILAMTVNEAIAFFNAQRETDKKHATMLRGIVDKLSALEKVGLGYVTLAQSSSTLSGGENQRVKLAYHISQERAEPTLFIFDEPTTGLHFHDIRKLLAAFDELIQRGHTVLIIEHNMEVIKCADHIIDLGPEGGNKGGNIVIAGTPEQVVKSSESLTGKFLKEKLMS